MVTKTPKMGEEAEHQWNARQDRIIKTEIVPEMLKDEGREHIGLTKRVELAREHRRGDKKARDAKSDPLFR